MLGLNFLGFGVFCAHTGFMVFQNEDYIDSITINTGEMIIIKKALAYILEASTQPAT